MSKPSFNADTGILAIEMKLDCAEGDTNQLKLFAHQEAEIDIFR